MEIHRLGYARLFFAVFLLLQGSLAAPCNKETVSNEKVEEILRNHLKTQKVPPSTKTSPNRDETTFTYVNGAHDVPHYLESPFRSMLHEENVSPEFSRIAEGRVSNLYEDSRIMTDLLTTPRKHFQGPSDASSSETFEAVPKVVLRPLHSDIPSPVKFRALVPNPAPTPSLNCITDINDECKALGSFGFPNTLFTETCWKLCKKFAGRPCDHINNPSMNGYVECAADESLGFKGARSCCFYELCSSSVKPPSSEDPDRPGKDVLWQFCMKRLLEKKCPGGKLVRDPKTDKSESSLTNPCRRRRTSN